MPKSALLRVLACLLLVPVFGCAGVCSPSNINVKIKDFWTGKPTVEELKKRVDQAVNLATAQINNITAANGSHTLENTLCPYDQAGWILELASSQMRLLRVAHPNTDLRQAATQAEQRLEQLTTDLHLNRAVFLALRALDTSKEDAVTRWYVEREMRAFKLTGVDRDEATRLKVVAARNELLRIEQQFRKNIAEGGSQMVVKDREDLRGLPPDFFAAHPARPDGSILLTTNPGDAFPVYTYAQSASLRRRMFHAYENQGYPRNRPLLQQMAGKRSDLAQVLGYASWADYASANLMSGSAQTIQTLISQVDDATREANTRYEAELLALKRKDDPAANGLFGDDFFYYNDQLKRSKHSFNAQELRPYFPYEQTEKGLLDTAARLFHVSIAPVKNQDVWEPSVTTWEVSDRGKVIGRFFLDMHPRPGKDKWFSMTTLRPGIAGEQIPEGALICNYPASRPGAPALLDHADTVSLFHELGHLMNQMLGTQAWAGLSGLAFERDFVELPSQLIEEWMKDPAVLQQFAKHYQSGQAIPVSLINSLNRADRVGRASGERAQIWFSDFSLKLHSSQAGTVDPEQLWHETYHRFFHQPDDPDEHSYVSFVHWVDYTSNYYIYSWDRVIKWDFLDQFDRHHLMADGPTWKYRRTVLEPGSSKPASDLVKDFLGRPQRIDSYRRWIDEEYAALQ